MKTPEQIAAGIVQDLSFTSNRMVDGHLVGEQNFAADAIAKAIVEDRLERPDAQITNVLTSVVKMRAAQRRYFKSRLPLDVREAKRWEAIVDAGVCNVMGQADVERIQAEYANEG